jgi:hypothetical protein
MLLAGSPAFFAALSAGCVAIALAFPNQSPLFWGGAVFSGLCAIIIPLEELRIEIKYKK